MVSMARPFLADADFVNKAPPAAPTRSTPASPATRPAWTTSSHKLASCLVNPRACHETELRIAPRPRRRRSPWSAPARPGWRAATTLAERGHEVTCSTPPPPSAASSTWRAAFPARRSSARPCATSPRSSRTGVHLHLGTGRGRRPNCWRLRPRRGGHRRHPAHPADPRPGPPQGAQLHRPAVGAQRRWAARGHHRRRRHRLRRRRVPAQPPRSPRASHAAAAQSRQARRRPGQDHRLDPPRRAEDEANVEMLAASTTSASARAACSSPSAPSARRHAAGGRHHRAVRRPGAAARAAGAACTPPASRPT
jgi:hypothetical protein